VTDVINTILDELGQLPLWATLLTVCVVMALETTMLVGVVVPGDIVVLFAASTDRPVPELVLVAVAVTLGSLTGETVGFSVGRRWGSKLRASRPVQRLGEERWDRAADYLHQRGGRAVFVARYLAAIHAVTPIVAGSLGMRYRRFIAWCAAGGVSWSALYVVLGAVAGASYRQYAHQVEDVTSVAVGGLVGAGVFVAAGAVLRRRVLPRLPRLPLEPASRLHLSDVVVVTGLAGLVAVVTATAEEAGAREPTPLAYAVVVGAALALLGWRRWPVAVLAVTVAAFAAYHVLDLPSNPPILAVAAAVYGAARAGRRTPALVAGGLVTGGHIAHRWLVEGSDALGVEATLGAALLVTVALLGEALLGEAVRTGARGAPHPATRAEEAGHAEPARNTVEPDGEHGAGLHGDAGEQAGEHAAA
jgi:membrane-associated protein